ncbi:aminotransferase class IV [Beijerinckia indica]|uniref:Probable branched-chain-amino-acid aminotransferase n=1 Tax=Beijerinckia indica subsp. indica (strain ATCC 9039 / DSM 1715 / NCIMB 8712) TaxID=395963 RepID=B2IJ18_BEII9|nr:aminotransferase class IV [Beijerinckia indica]ACB94781.1 aminotransferase class IV [Beijerinckia indica subsp. indica ATCC 9039]
MPLFWSDGALFETAVHPYDLTDRGLLLGDGLFDTALVLRGKVHREMAHRMRLLEGLSEIGIAMAPEIIIEAFSVLAHASRTKGIERAALRVMITRGPGPRGLGLPPTPLPHLLASLAPLANNPSAPLTLHVSKIRRNETSPLSRLKTLSSLDAVLAHREALNAGCDEALCLNTAGRIACAASGNLFAVFGRKILTPKLGEGLLPGCIRALLLAEGASLGYEMIETELECEHLLAAEAVFMTNSLRLLAPVSRIDDVSFVSASHAAFAALRDFVWRHAENECGVANHDV